MSAERQSSLDLDRLIDEFNLKKTDLFRIKENGRLVLAEFINSEVISFNESSSRVNIFSLSYKLDFNGDLNGRIYLNLNKKIALEVAGILFESQFEDINEDVEEALKETLNIFSGHLSTFLSTLGHEVEIDVPESTNYDLKSSQARKKILFRFSCREEVIQFIFEID